MVNVDSNDICNFMWFFSRNKKTKQYNVNNVNFQTKAYAKTYVRRLRVFTFSSNNLLLFVKSNLEEFLKN